MDERATRASGSSTVMSQSVEGECVCVFMYMHAETCSSTCAMIGAEHHHFLRTTDTELPLMNIKKTKKQKTDI